MSNKKNPTKVEQKKTTKEFIDKKTTKNQKINPKINSKKQIKELKTYAKNREHKIMMVEIQNQKNIYEFQEKAKSFSLKAETKVNNLKKSLNKEAKENQNQVKMYGSQKLLESILEPINNIKVVVDINKNTDNASIRNYVQGFDMLIKQLFNELKFHGLKNIVPKIGDHFDPQEHEVVSTINGKNKNKIIEIKKIGFKLHDRIIKPAMVVIEK